MPKVHFVHEHVTVEVEPGRRLSDVARERGIAVCRQSLGWTGVGDYTVWVEGAPDATTPRTFWERLRRMKGWRRLANHTRVLGDVRIWTQQGLGDRNGGSRDIDAPPNPSADPDAVRHPPDAAGTAWCPYGHPSAVGSGERQPPAAEAKGKEPPGTEAKKAGGAKAPKAEAD